MKKSIRRDVFWDTNGFYALMNSDDGVHQLARGLLSEFQAEKRIFVTTDGGVGETCTLLGARKGEHLISRFLELIRGSHALRRLFVSPDQISVAEKFFVKGNYSARDKRYRKEYYGELRYLWPKFLS